MLSAVRVDSLTFVVRDRHNDEQTERIWVHLISFRFFLH